MFGNMFSFAKTKVAVGLSVWQVQWHGVIVCRRGSTSPSLMQGARVGSGQLGTALATLRDTARVSTEPQLCMLVLFGETAIVKEPVDA